MERCKKYYIKKMRCYYAAYNGRYRTNTISRIGGNEETRRFLANLGFVAGAEVVVLSKIGGNVIVNVKDSRVAVNEDMARHIMV